VILQARRSKLLAKASAFGRFVENTLLSLLLAGMIGLAALQIVLRWSDLGSLVWGDEAIRLMVLWIAMVAGIAAAREDRHIAIDVLSRFLGARSKAFTAVIADLFTAGVCLALAWYGWGMLRFAIEDGDVFFGNLPAWFFQSIIPVAFALMAYRYFLWFLRGLRTLFSGDTK
jgi:TRAP-type C4-dicarboxylate transport system permease small subunit